MKKFALSILAAVTVAGFAPQTFAATHDAEIVNLASDDTIIVVEEDTRKPADDTVIIVEDDKNKNSDITIITN